MKSTIAETPIICDATSEQVQCWKYHNNLDDSKEHQISVLYENIRRLNTTGMEQAIEATFRRHESLRTVFRMVGRRLKQFILPYDKDLFSPLSLDFSDEKDGQAAVEEAINQFKRALRKMDAPPLVRFGVSRRCTPPVH